MTIDTLRADRVGVYGHKQAMTPALDALAGRGVRFADATAHAPLTHPSHAAIMTGRYPGAFGIRLNGMTPLPAEATTVAERFRAAGYATGAVVASVILDEAYGMGQGFESYDDRITAPAGGDVALSSLQRRADEVTDRALAWLASRSAKREGWFLWVHYYDPHLPYDAKSGTDPNFNNLVKNRPYDAEVAYVDQQLARLLRGLDTARTLVAVTSDHGEALGDHGEGDHGYFIYDATLHVPLIIAGPGIAPRVVTEQVRLIDVAPTLADLAGLDRQPATGNRQPMDGESLRALMHGGARRDVPPSYAESWYPKLHFGWSELRSLRVGEWKHIAAPKPELYDLRTDPGELKNVIAARGSVAARMAADMQTITSGFDARAAETPAAAPDPDAVARLRALGYVGSMAPTASTAGGDDPKDRLGDYLAYRTEFNRALGLLSRAQALPTEAARVRMAAEAGALLQGLVKRNVRAYEAHLYLGQAYAAQKKFDAALGEFDASSLLNPQNAQPHFEAAKAFAAKGDTAAAVKRAEQGLALDPQSFYGHYTLGTIRLRANQPTEAAPPLAKAVALNPDDPRARANLAEAAMRTRALALAREQYEKLVELNYRLPESHFNLGVIAEARRDIDAARRHYQAALKANPRFQAARLALARLK
ncbi:MAG TPA: sulfatase-like hydrolase/transferase [Vicinamibacterales bacterium]|nr:sulfatase-like hydrolase/transferase [Vicinamibacterales bacterium]